MAKKKTVKKMVQKVESTGEAASVVVSPAEHQIVILQAKMVAVNARIDRIVDAVSKSKSVKGL